MDNLVQLTRKNRYGKEVYAPANDMALLATYLSGTVEVTDWMINALKRFGCTVEVIAQKETL